MAAGSCLTFALVDFTCSLHTTRHLLLGITNAFHAFSIHSTKMYAVLFLCHGLCLPGAGVKASVGGRACVYLIYVFPAPSREPGTQRVFKNIGYSIALSLL